MVDYLINNQIDDHNINGRFGLDDLERRRKAIFADIPYNEQYAKIKEKLIGITLQYQGDISSIMHKLIESRGIEKELKDILKSKIKIFTEIMENRGHQNLRTFQFFLSKIDYIYSEYMKTDNIEHSARILGFIVENSFLLCVQYKINNHELANNNDKIFCKESITMESIKGYIHNSIWKQDIFEREIIQYIEDSSIQQLNSGDPYCLLYNHYYLESQEWVEEKLKGLLNNLSNGLYPIKTYRSIIVLFVLIENMGFEDDFRNQAIEMMVSNIRKERKFQLLSTEYFAIEGKKDSEKCKEIIDDINDKLRQSYSILYEEKIKKLRGNIQNWVEELKIMVEGEVDNGREKYSIIYKLGSEVVGKLLTESNPRNIHLFRNNLDNIYSRSEVLDDINNDEKKVIEEIIEILENHTEKDLIKKKQLIWLKEDLLKISSKLMVSIQ